MSNWLEWFESPYAEDTALLNDWIEHLIKEVSVKLFHYQHDIVYMANETDNNIPKLKDEAVDVIRQTVYFELGWVVDYVISRILVAYAKNNIDLGDEGRWYIDEQLDPEDAADFWTEIDEYIWSDYARFLGEEKTAKLWEKWGKTSLYTKE